MAYNPEQLKAEWKYGRDKDGLAHLLSGEPVALGGQELLKSGERKQRKIHQIVDLDSRSPQRAKAVVIDGKSKVKPLQFLLDRASGLGVQDLESGHDNVLGVST